MSKPAFQIAGLTARKGDKGLSHPMSNPLLSVVIPTWNRAYVVCEAIESAMAQGPGRVQIIAVDDGSTDGTADELASRYGSDVQLLRMPCRSGVGAARNAGALKATGEFLAFLDSDDLWLPGKLDAELAAFEQFPAAEAIVSDSVVFKEHRPNDRTWFANNGLLGATGGRANWLSECSWLWTNWRNVLQIGSITLRRSAASRLGQLFAEDLNSAEDWEFELRAWHLCRVLVLPEVWTHVRRFDNGTRVGRPVPGNHRTLSQEIGILADLSKIIDRYPYLSGLGTDLAGELERCRVAVANQLASFRSLAASSS